MSGIDTPAKIVKRWESTGTPYPRMLEKTRKAHAWELPGAANKLRISAGGWGWNVVTLRAVGRTVETKRRKAMELEGIAVLMWGPDPVWRAVAIWEHETATKGASWKFVNAYAWKGDEDPRVIKLTDNRRDKGSGESPELLESFLTSGAMVPLF